MYTFSQTVAVARNDSNSAADAIFKVPQQLSGDEATLFAWILQSIWKQRNNTLWNDTIEAQNSVFMQPKVVMQDWKAVHEITNGAELVQADTKLSSVKKALPFILEKKAIHTTQNIIC
jgi:hypothetical protein